MKRITWWPQAWLGLVFSWAALVGWSEIAGGRTLPGLMHYAGCICWVIGYDRIYALQVRENYALIFIKSSALRIGRHVRHGGSAFSEPVLLRFSDALGPISRTVLPTWAAFPVEKCVLY